MPAIRAEVRAAGRYVFRADITAFYHSIYTHSLAWAIHGKDVAKANRAIKATKKAPQVLWGNLADLWSRNLQDGQTIGLPVGPDTSFALSETLLCAIDLSLVKLLGDIPGFRFVDDFEFVCTSQTQAEAVLASVQEVLSQFELRLNPRKTSIRELPQALDTPWVEDLHAYELSEGPGFSTRLIRYFTKAFALAREYPGEPVLKYAVGRIERTASDVDCALLLQRLLMQTAVADPGTLQFVLRTIYVHRENGGDVDVQSLRKALDLLIQRHAPLGHGSEVAWCIWAAAVFKVELADSSSDAIALMADDVVALTAMFCEGHGVFASPPVRDLWQALVNANAAAREHWLLVYEAVGKGWLKSAPAGDLKGAAQYMTDLRNAAVEFVDSNADLAIAGETIVGIYGTQ